MCITLDIPESTVSSLQVPDGDAEARIRMELAVTLYAQGLLSFGKAAELAGLSLFQFADVVTLRGIPRHYGAEELAEDLAYANGQ